MLYQYYHSRALNGRDSEASRGVIWAGSDMLLYKHSGRQHYHPLGGPLYTGIMAARKNLAGKADHLKPLVLSYMHFCI